MAKKTKDTTATAAKKEAKAKAPADPAATKNLVRLLNVLALLLAITAFLLQFFAVITNHWKYQNTSLKSIYQPADGPAQAYVADDSRIEQDYGLYDRNVKVYANNDEQLNIWTNTRFPHIVNDNDDDLHQCLSGTSTFRGALLTCSYFPNTPQPCHCGRYAYWNAVIFFEVAALVLLGLVVFLSALLSTQFSQLLKLAATGLAFIAFLFLLVGLILILSYLKRETRTLADVYPHAHSRIANLVNQRYQTVLHKAVRRQAHETYRAYSLSHGQHPHNQTHFQQFSEQTREWVYVPYTSLDNSYAPRTQKGTTQRTTTSAPTRNAYGPLVGQSTVYENTRAGICWSTVLSILALILSLLIPALLAFSWLTAKKLAPEVKTVTTTTVRTEYVPVPQEVAVETVPLNQPVVVRDVVIHSDQPPTTTQTYRT